MGGGGVAITVKEEIGSITNQIKTELVEMVKEMEAVWMEIETNKK